MIDFITLSIALANQKKLKEFGSGYTLKGQVDTYDDLPASGNTVGDCYMVATDDGTHGSGPYVWGTVEGTLTWFALDTLTKGDLREYTAAEVDTLYNT